MHLFLTCTRTAAVASWLALYSCIVPGLSSFNFATDAASSTRSYSQIQTGITRITVTSKPLEESGKRFGINLGQQTFYGSGQMLKNLIFRNPGFEGTEYRSIIRCKNAQGHSCEDANGSAAWTTNFWRDADFRFLSGKRNGKNGRLEGFDIHPARFGFPSNVFPDSGDYFLVTKQFAGDPTAGWWAATDGGATFAAEFKDLSPQTGGKQALSILAGKPGASARLTSYFDTYADGHPQQTPAHSFLRMNGRYELTFRAKALSPLATIAVQVDRAGSGPFLQRSVPLSNSWRDYVIHFDAQDDPANTHAVELQFTVKDANILLDDVSLVAASDDAGGTAFRKPVVDALEQFHPGVLRLMASTTQLGSSMANLLAFPDARVRSGYSAWNLQQDDIPIGIPEFLELCARLGAEPWITLPTATSAEDAQLLLRFLTEKHGEKQSKQNSQQGQTWTERFACIHLEIGNEAWNGTFQGETIEDATAYGQHAQEVFRAFRAGPGFRTDRFDLVVGGQSEWPQRNQAILAAAGNSYDSLAIAPYIWRSIGDASDEATLFGPLMAEPELMDRHGEVRQNSDLGRNASHVAKLAVYEVNLHSTGGSASQSTLDRTTPSLAGGLAVAAHMLQMRRDDGIQTQLLFNLPEFDNQRSDKKTIKLWGSVVDMGVTDRRRPVFELLAMINQVTAGRMLQTQQRGADPTWLAATTSAGGAGEAVHAIQSFAFDLPQTHERAVVILNLSLMQQIVQLEGVNPAVKSVTATSVTGASPASNNEDGTAVTRESSSLNPQQLSSLNLKPMQALLLRWKTN